MKLTTLADVTVYRMHVPRWAVAPTSGAGAAKYGGRANRPGVEALYLAMKTETAIHEFQHVSTLLPGAVPPPCPTPKPPFFDGDRPIQLGRLAF